MLPTPARNYILSVVDNTPATLSALLSHLPADSFVWNTQPDPDRFSLREIVAHLADWEEVFRGRFERTLGEDRPLLQRPDVSQRAEDLGYGQADPTECLARFREKRASLTGWLRSLSDDDWARGAHLDRMGDIPLEALPSLVLSHDSYHLRQVAEWLAHSGK